MEEKEDGLTFGEIFHVILIKKWILLAVTVLVMLFGVIFVQVLYNPSKTQYISTFEIKYPNSETNRYPDGTEFLYKEFISLDNLKRAKEQKESFSSIDVEKMQKAISITEGVININNTPTKTGEYTVTVLKKYFKDSDQAEDFITTLMSLPVNDIKEKSKTIEYDRFLKQFDYVGDYISQVGLLISQKDMLIQGYESMISKYSNAVTIKSGDNLQKTVNEAQNEIEGYFSFYDLVSMKSEVELNGYIKPDSDYLTSIRNEIEKLSREKESNVKKMDAIYEQISQLRDTLAGTVTDVAFQEMFSSIAALAQRNVEIDHLIEVVYHTYLVGSSMPEYSTKLAAFQERLEQHYTKLQEFTNDYKAFNEEIYEQNTKLLFESNSIIIEEGGFNILIALVAFLVIGFVLTSCLNLALDLPKYLKQKKALEVEPILEEPIKEETE